MGPLSFLIILLFHNLIQERVDTEFNVILNYGTSLLSFPFGHYFSTSNHDLVFNSKRHWGRSEKTCSGGGRDANKLSYAADEKLLYAAFHSFLEGHSENP